MGLVFEWTGQHCPKWAMESESDARAVEKFLQQEVVFRESNDNDFVKFM